jgi:hypothetical protein
MGHNEPLTFEHTVECQASTAFAWRFWTDMNNWAIVDPAVEWAKLDGPFMAGAGGITKPKGSEPIEWKVAAVREGQEAIIEISLPGAVLHFTWIFDGLGNQRTRITQRVSLNADRNEDYFEAMAGLRIGIPAGMQKLADAIAGAEGRSSQ